MLYKDKDTDRVRCKNELEYSQAIGQHALLCRNPTFGNTTVNGGVELDCKNCNHRIHYTPSYPTSNEWKQKFDNFIEQHRPKK